MKEMPYITKEEKEQLEPLAAKLGQLAFSPGQLNFIFTTIIHEYIKNIGAANMTRLKYGYINEVIGALECCKLELYRRVAAPYEDKKIAENGDVGCLNDNHS
jgi:hypothetical protein